MEWNGTGVCSALLWDENVSIYLEKVLVLLLFPSLRFALLSLPFFSYRMNGWMDG